MNTQPKSARKIAPRAGERGATMILVAVGLSFIILAIAALAVDLVALYSAHNDARLAADAAALAGAKVIANSGYTTDQTTIQWSTIQPMATNVAKAVAMQNKIGGQPIPQANIHVAFNTGNANFNSNPQVTVSVTNSGIPAFFSRIWGNSVLPVAATAGAEAYNPSGNLLPVQPQCVKPWVIPNFDKSGNPLFDPASGIITTAAPIAGQLYTLTSGCGGAGCVPVNPAAPGVYYPTDIPAPPSSGLPPTCALGTCSYEQNIAACSPQPVLCGTTQLNLANITTCGSAADYKGMTNSGMSCLIHGSGATGSGQDCLNADAGSCAASTTSTLTTQIFAGQNNPLKLDGVVSPGDQISTSSSLVTIPVASGMANGLTPPAQVTIIGFVQGFIRDTSLGGPTSGNIDIYLVNISGCGAGVTGSPVQGDGISPVPVHLIGN